MNLDELKIYRLGMGVLSGTLTIKEFSEQIGKSYRQSQRIIKKLRERDFEGVFHGNLGRVPHNKTPQKFEDRIIDLLKHRYYGFNLTHFREMILKYEKIEIKKDVLHRIAKTHGLVKHPKRRGRRCYKPRPRLEQEGMMIQFDGSNHVWFGEERTDLIGGIDDATGKVVAAELFYGEKSNHSLKVIREIIDKNGLPESFYMDQAGIYGKADREWESQIARAFQQTGIRLILAGSSQAKGRVERLWRTFQDRLVAELSLYQITDIEEANQFLKNKFIPRYNAQFSVEASSKEKAYRKNVFGDLDIIFCKKLTRKIMSGNLFSWENVSWIIDKKTDYCGREISVNLHIDGSYSFDLMGRKVNCKPHSLKKLSHNEGKTRTKRRA